MKHIKLHPVRTNQWRNYWLRWPRCKQVVASMLLWASRADATQIIFDPSRDLPLVYSNAIDDHIKTELPDPPDEVVDALLRNLQCLAIDDSWFGLVRPERDFSSGKELDVSIAVADVETRVTHNWIMTVGDTMAKFTSSGNLL